MEQERKKKERKKKISQLFSFFRFGYQKVRFLLLQALLLLLQNAIEINARETTMADRLWRPREGRRLQAEKLKAKGPASERSGCRRRRFCRRRRRRRRLCESIRLVFLSRVALCASCLAPYRPRPFFFAFARGEKEDKECTRLEFFFFSCSPSDEKEQATRSIFCRFRSKPAMLFLLQGQREKEKNSARALFRPLRLRARDLMFFFRVI